MFEIESQLIELIPNIQSWIHFTKPTPTTSCPTLYRQTSLITQFPLAGEVNCRFGSDSHVIAPLNLRMYLYWKEVLAGMFTVTTEIFSFRTSLGTYKPTTPDRVVVRIECKSIIRRPVDQRVNRPGQEDVFYVFLLGTESLNVF